MRAIRRPLVLPLLLAAAAAAVLLPASARRARADEAFDKVVAQAKDQQDGLIQDALKQAGQDADAALAGVARLVERYRATVQTQGSALSHYLYGRILYRQYEAEGAKDAHRKDEALQAFESALGRDPRIWQALYGKVVVYDRAGDTARGDAALEDMLRRFPAQPEAVLLQGKRLFDHGKFADAKGAAEKLLRVNSGNMAARDLLAMSYMGLGEWKLAEETVRSMIARGADNPTVRLRLVDCLMAQKKHDEAEKEVLTLIQRFPKEVQLRLIYADVLVARGNLPRAIQVVQQVVDAYPDDVAVQVTLGGLHVQAKQLEAAERVFRHALDLCTGPDERRRALRPEVMRQLAIVLAAQSKGAEALRLLEQLDKLVQGEMPPQILDLMQQLYAQAGRRADLVKTLKRLLPYLEDRPEELEKLKQRIRELEEGGDLQPAQDGPWGRNERLELLERVTSKDVNARRKALFEYYQLDLPYVDPVVYLRYRPETEPDGECRLWVVKILSRFTVQQAAPETVRSASRYVGLALEDPVRTVRSAAAEGLRHIATPAGLVYLEVALEQMKLDAGGAAAETRAQMEEEYNAMRLALVALTGRQDVPIGAPDWVKLEDAAANRSDWVAWHDSSAAVPARLKALDDLDTVEAAGPLWAWRYVLNDLMRDPAVRGATPPAVFLRTYRLIKRHMLLARKERPEEFAADPKMATFPLFDDADVTEENIPKIRQTLLDYYRQLKR